MTPMPIADTLLRPGVKIINSWEKPAPDAFARVMRKELADSHFVRCDAIANGVWRDHMPNLNPPRHTPTWHLNAPYRPPFDKMWIEWTVAPELRNAAQIPISDIAVGIRVIPIEEWDNAPKGLPDDAAVGVIVEKFLKSQPGYDTVMWVGTDNIWVGRDGRFINAMYIRETLHKGLTEEAFQTSLTQFMRPAFSAIALMNCKNVALVPEAAPRRPKKSKPDRIPRIQFHTIHVPGMDYGGGGTTEPSHQDMARHYVRGHFKTYTADAPLLGKAVGTYWWGWQARGSKKNGIVVSDYEVDRAS